MIGNCEIFILVVLTFWKMFGQIGTNTLFGSTTTTIQSYNPMKDIEVTSPPDDTISSLAFSPGSLAATYLTAGSWDNNVSNFCVSWWNAYVARLKQSHLLSLVCWFGVSCCYYYIIVKHIKPFVKWRIISAEEIEGEQVNIMIYGIFSYADIMKDIIIFFIISYALIWFLCSTFKKMLPWLLKHEIKIQM